MIVFYILLATLIAILGISSYSYEQIDPVTSDSEVSRKLLLSTIIITSVIIFFSFFLIFTKYFDYQRSTNMLSFGTLVTSILMMLSFSYLDKERGSNSLYDTRKNDLVAVENNTNSKERDLSLIIAIVGLSIVAAYLFVIIGKVFYSETVVNTVTIKEPLIVDSIDSKPVNINYEKLRKKFIV
jgi:hypothetical protein